LYDLPYGRDSGEVAIKIWLGQSAVLFLLYWIWYPGHSDHKEEDKEINEEMAQESGFYEEKKK
jgi:hypothetical protein